MNTEIWKRYVEARRALSDAHSAHGKAWSLEATAKHEVTMAEIALDHAKRELLEAPEEFREPLKLVRGAVEKS